MILIKYYIYLHIFKFYLNFVFEFKLEFESSFELLTQVDDNRARVAWSFFYRAQAKQMRASLGCKGKVAPLWPEGHKFESWKQPLYKKQGEGCIQQTTLPQPLQSGEPWHWVFAQAKQTKKLDRVRASSFLIKPSLSLALYRLI